MVADFTYVWTAEGWLYVAAVIDLFSVSVLPSNWIIDWRRFYDFSPVRSPG
jgi:hypothetical protein